MVEYTKSSCKNINSEWSDLIIIKEINRVKDKCKPGNRIGNRNCSRRTNAMEPQPNAIIYIWEMNPRYGYKLVFLMIGCGEKYRKYYMFVCALNDRKYLEPNEPNILVLSCICYMILTFKWKSKEIAFNLQEAENKNGIRRTRTHTPSV